MLPQLTRVFAAGLICLVVMSCAERPTQPSGTTLPSGRWTGDGACLSVAPDSCELVAGCGHGHFPPPTIRADGSFEVDGTYRIEAGPISIDPPPPATFSGVLRGQTLTLKVTPRDPSLQATTYVMQLSGASGKCAVLCV